MADVIGKSDEQVYLRVRISRALFEQLVAANLHRETLALRTVREAWSRAVRALADQQNRSVPERPFGRIP